MSANDASGDQTLAAELRREADALASLRNPNIVTIFDVASDSNGLFMVMELLEGHCRVKLAGETEARQYRGGQSFDAPGNSSFEIETLETLHYVCHFA